MRMSISDGGAHTAVLQFLIDLYILTLSGLVGSYGNAHIQGGTLILGAAVIDAGC